MNTSTGYRLIEVQDLVQPTIIPVALLYPARGAERTERFGPYSLDVARDAPPLAERSRLIVISHGNGGTPWAYRDLVKHLVRSGFAVALPEHPGNSRNDNSLAGTAANWENRPRHLALTTDAVLADPVMKEHLTPARVSVIGHSIGGYTALALAGGQPWAAAHESLAGQPHRVMVTPDRRVRSLVLLAPATFWFLPENLHEVGVPILIRTGGKDEITPVSHAETVKSGVFDSSLVDHTAIPGAGHFSFMSKFPAGINRRDFPPSQDPQGFDREEIQAALFSDIVDFLNRTL